MCSWWRRLGAFIAMLTVTLAALPQASAIPAAARGTLAVPGLWTQGVNAVAPSPDAPGVLFLGMSGLKPSDLDLQGNQLGEMLVPFTFSALSTRSFRIYTCPTEGWMQLRARGDVADEEGRRLAKTVGSQCLGMKLVKGDGTAVQTPVQVEPAAATPLPNAAAVTYAQFKGRTENITWPTRGIFATDAWAVGRNAGIPLANRRGQVAHWLPLPVVPEMVRINPSTLDSLYNERTGAGARAALAAKAQQSTSPLGKTLKNRTSLESVWQSLLAAAPSDVVVDLDTVDTAVLNQNTYDTAKTLSLQQLSAILSANQSAAHPRPVIIASLGDFEGARSLQLLAAQTPGLALTGGESAAASDAGTAGAGVLYTSTTHAAGLATLADVRGLVLNARTYLDPKLVSPANITLPELKVNPVASVAEACSVITEQQRHASSALRANSRWYQVFHLLSYLAIGALIIWAFASRGSRRLANSWWVVRLLGLIAFAMLPAALILNWIPWWNLPGTDSTVGAIAVALALTAVIAAALVGILWRSPHAVSILAGISFFILALDIVLGSAHQRNGFMGSLVLSSRRYYGISNRTYIILIIGALLALLPVLQRFWGQRWAAWVTAGLGVAVLLIDALPGWGADFGGPPGIILAFGIVALMAAGVRPRWWHAGVWVVLTLGVMGAIGWFSRGSDSHIGNFWSNLGSSESQELIAGKVRDVLRSFENNLGVVILLALVVVALVVAMVMVKRRQVSWPWWVSTWDQLTDLPALRIVALGILLGMAVAVPINDSGMMIVKEAIYLVLPALSAVIAQRAIQLNRSPEPSANK
ncbi:tellurium resistance protein TerC [Mobiluncus sp.]|uniref:tellurium resistance protein TerC n=1 Tax=Mobiluncus sp. TaxID=47293 RepID=UPI002A9106F3|nr:tellurium resistance protein TerC [Mobiluncus sp.]MDY6076943.1 tellurium resistance protein TerC [Mobiluncus sp.]